MARYHIVISPENGNGCEFKDIIEAKSIVDAFKKAKDTAYKLNKANDHDNCFNVFSIKIESPSKKVD